MECQRPVQSDRIKYLYNQVTPDQRLYGRASHKCPPNHAPRKREAGSEEIPLGITTADFSRLERNARKRVKLAAAKALTVVAQASQTKIQAEIPQKFDTTKQWWRKNSPTGIKIKMATKATMTSEVFTGHKNTWLARHEFGDSRRPRGSMLIVPVYKKSGSSPDKADARFRGFKPQTWRKAIGRTTALAKYGRTDRAVKGKYPVVIQSSKGDTLIKRGKGQPFKVVFTEKRTTKRMKKRLNFRKIVKRTVRKEFSRIFREKLALAGI